MRLIQSRYRDPWKMTVAAILLNRTRGQQVRPVLGPLFRAYPTPARMATAGPELEELIRPLGLWRRRADALRRFSADWLDGVPVGDCYGVGQYALDSYRIFALGDLTVRPADVELRRYVEHHRRTRANR